MSEAEGRAIGLAFLDHPEHELYDEALPGEIQGMERLLGVKLPPSYRGFLQVGSGGILATGALLLGTKDPEELGASLHAVTIELRREGLPPHLLPVVDGERFFCFDLSVRDAEDESPVVELDPETFAPIANLGSFPAFAREVLLPS